MINFGYTIWIPLIPLIFFLLLGLAGHKLKARLSGLIGTGGLGLVTLLSYITAYFYFFGTDKVDGAFQKIQAFNMTWLQLTDKLETTTQNLFAIGDGAGITRGLMQSSASGVIAAREILHRLGA